MKCVLLGSGGYYANEARHTACVALPEAGIVLDAGSGMFRLGDYLATDQLDIFLSHAHLDHILGLTYLLDVIPESIVERTTIHGDAAKLEAIRTHLFSQPLFPVMPKFKFEPLDGPDNLAAGCRVSHFPLKHPGGSIGFRLDWPDCSLAYVTDTRATVAAPYVEQIRGANVLVHEAYFADDNPEMARLTGHSCSRDVAAVAAAAEVDLLVLVHVNPRVRQDADFHLAPVQTIFANTILGADRMEIEF